MRVASLSDSYSVGQFWTPLGERGYSYDDGGSGHDAWPFDEVAQADTESFRFDQAQLGLQSDHQSIAKACLHTDRQADCATYLSSGVYLSQGTLY